MAGGIYKKNNAEVLDSGFEDSESISYCPRCEKNGLKKIMQQRIYRPDQLINGKEPRDADQWKQCHFCGQILPLYEVKVESRLQDFIEPSENPHDQGKQITGLDNKKKLTPTQKERKKQRDRIDKEKDPDIKRELLCGNIVKI